VAHSYYRWLIAIHNIVIGLKSGFPLCCISYFTRHDDGSWLAKQGRDKSLERPGYVRCPQCIRDGFIKKRSQKQKLAYTTMFNDMFPTACHYLRTEAAAKAKKHDMHDCGGEIVQLKNHLYCTNCYATLVEVEEINA
jgi:hypothetical protein